MTVIRRFLVGNRTPRAAGELPPKKVAWLNPWQLVVTAYHTWLSTQGTGLLDRREVLAALGNAGPLPRSVRSANTAVKQATRIDGILEHAGKDPIWVDYVADVGDSWEATYAVASLLARRDLWERLPPAETVAHKHKCGCDHLPPGDILTVGGDLVYPRASRNSYLRRFRAPFRDAFPPAQPQPRNMFMIPGNHDWYDGLTHFIREFCQGGQVGGWTLRQRRSYFAVKLGRGWWLWGIDIALDTRIDAPQQGYFTSILSTVDLPPTVIEGDDNGWPDEERFEKGDRIILCTAKPGWLDISRYGDDAYDNLASLVDTVEHFRTAANTSPAATIPLILSGDLHHYSRYGNDQRQLVVAGGGGAYLMGTHFLPQIVAPLEVTDNARTQATDDAPQDQPPKRTVRTATSPGKPSYEEAGGSGPQSPEKAFLPSVPTPHDLTYSSDDLRGSVNCYPDRLASRRLALNALLLPLRSANWSFCVFVGVLYLMLTWQAAPVSLPPNGCDAYVLGVLPQCLWSGEETYVRTEIIASLFVAACGLFAVFSNQRTAPVWTGSWGALHGAGHVWLAFAAARWYAPWYYLDWIGLGDPVRFWLAAALFVVVSGVLGGELLAVYLVISDRYFGLHTNEVFLVQSIIDYRSFLKVAIRSDGSLLLFPVGLREVPRRWRRAVDREPCDPIYEPADAILSPHFIEGPIEYNLEDSRWQWKNGNS